LTATPPPPLTTELQLAIAFHQAGQLQEAEGLYKAILQTHPDHPEAHHNMGVLAMQRNLPAAGLPHFLAALEADQTRGQYWLSYIDALFQADQLFDARQMLALARQQGLQGAEVDALMRRLEGDRHAEHQQAIEKPAAVSPSVSNKTAKSEKSGKPTKKSALHPSPTQQEIESLVASFSGGHYTEAQTLAQAMTVRFPLHWVGWKMLGVLFNQTGRSAEALIPMQKAVALSPYDAEAHNNLGITLNDLGRLNEACASYRQALTLNPDYAQAHSNLGATLQDLGRLNDAEACYRRAIQINPNYAKAYNNLGACLLFMDRPDEAEASFLSALQIMPDYTDALNNLASLLNEQDKSILALKTINLSLQIQETREAKSIFIACVKRLHFTQDDNLIRATMTRALTEPWGSLAELSRIGMELVKLTPCIAACVTRATSAWPVRLSAQDLFGQDGFSVLATDNLLYALLESAPICDVEIEYFLTMVRSTMLDAAIKMTVSDSEIDASLSFYSAIARQCFINEYIFSYTADEIKKAGDLRNALAAALDTNTIIPVLWPIVVAAYFPLYSLPTAARLFDRQWPEAVTAILVPQVKEFAEELQLRATIPKLTSVENEVSLLVQNQYEENPYPRWIKTPPAGNAKNIVRYLCQKYPLASFKRQATSGNIDVLIAGCGTGQHPIGSAQRILGAHVLAVDLSMSSLAYAMRKTREMGLTSIEYAQADLLKLGSLDRRFDIIESSGVLHHLADPWTGWRVLLSRLRPNGFMKLGFYSEVARRNIVRIRSFIAEHGYGSTSDEIRRCRQDLMDLDHSADFGATLKSPDFFSTSACRDLLFHVQEHRMTLTGIEAFLRENNLTFIGFEIDSNALHAYKLRFPADRAATNLGQWQIFENENTDTFAGMYQFWIQKAD
jgi:Flp pilus assembly protein TadD/SAM-dependent methyltransferase